METDTFLDKIPDDLNDLYLTILTPDGTSTFARDNAEHFKPWFLVQLAKLNNQDRKWGAIVLVKRQFTQLKDTKTGLPIKKISACRLEKEGVCVPLTAEETRSAFHVDAKTGKLLKPEPHVTFVDFC